MFGVKKLAKKSSIATGIDIGSFSVKVAQISKKNEAVTLESFGYSKIDYGRLDGVVDAIRKACVEASLNQKNVIASIAPEGVIVRYFTLPEMNTEELRRAMEFEIERYVPFERENVVSDYMVLRDAADSKNLKILLVAAKKEYVEGRVKVLKEADLEPEVITIDSIVLKNVFQLNYPEKKNQTVGILNIGSKASNINIIRDSVSYFMRDVQLGGDNITQLLKEKLDLSIDEAEQLKYRLTFEDKEKFKIIEPVLGNLLNELYLSFDYYESEFGMVVDEVFISGGTANLGLLSSFLKENLNRDITILNAVNKISCAPSIAQQRVEGLGGSLAIAIGLALESYN